MPATATITRASLSAGRCLSKRCSPATPTSRIRAGSWPMTCSVMAASSATGKSLVPAAITTTPGWPGLGSAIEPQDVCPGRHIAARARGTAPR